MTPLLSVRGLVRRYGALVAVDHVEFTVLPGEVHAVIGPNGAGKSSFLALLAGEARPDAGEIEFAGTNITRLPAFARARLGIARAFQITAVIPDFPVLQNAVLAVLASVGRGFGMGRAAMHDPVLLDGARRLLARVGLAAQESRLAGDLAHGAQRQLELAMALAGRPRLLLLDEPIAGTGPEESRAMVALLQSIRQAPGERPGIVLVEHDLEAVFALADRITVMAEGRVIACDVPDRIRADAAVRAAYLGDDAR
ncbi:ABC transporter ATP-binding protein [Allostella vacuolata]|nr:ABC transporter ATP-binding protein [Stella vacuolata]